ncbi:hypothetical protein AMD27_16260 (plasmid) [Acinetobacter sp. TGL-Y2]|uniref:hypothetical protein n=1 Tax=Acinetobacter sp. TGL-Y2 TaxID=1407071 RepID=UPI0007A64E1F|nr:hypothetical protein [Acinetobacter sp. TGL-Y2]AMW80471.1 hypothetical protein AMD27_16260 [Acinetobacter sp. TGL-Y2]
MAAGVETFTDKSIKLYENIWVRIFVIIFIITPILIYYYNRPINEDKQSEYQRFMQVSKQHNLKGVLEMNDSFLADDQKIDLEEYKRLQKKFVSESDKRLRK